MGITQFQAEKLAIQALLDDVGIDIVLDECPPPLAAETVRTSDGWEVSLLWGEEFVYEVGEDGSCSYNGESSNVSRFTRWFFPDDRFNPEDGLGHSPVC